MLNKNKIFAAGLKKLIKIDEVKDQQEIASDIGKAKSTFHSWVSGRTKIPIDMLEPISRSLGMSVEQVIEHGKRQLYIEPTLKQDSKSPPELTSEADELQRELITVYRDLTEAQKTIARLTARIAELESNRQEELTEPHSISSSGIL